MRARLLMLWATSATSFSILSWFSASLVCVGYNLEMLARLSWINNSTDCVRAS